MIMLKRRFTVNILSEFKNAFTASKSVSGNTINNLYYLVCKGRSNFLLRTSNKKRAKNEKKKEIELIEDDEYAREVQFLSEISDLESKIKEYKLFKLRM